MGNNTYFGPRKSNRKTIQGPCPIFEGKFCYQRYKFYPVCQTISDKLVNYISSKASCYTIIIHTVISGMCTNCKSSNIYKCHNGIVNFVCKNIIYGFSN